MCVMIRRSETAQASPGLATLAMARRPGQARTTSSRVAIFPTEYSMDMARLASSAEERGFESLWVAEHTHIPARGQQATLTASTKTRHAPSLRCLFRPHPDEKLAWRVVALRAHELRECALDLGPGLLLVGAAEPGHQLAQGKGPSCVLHGFCQGRETPPSGNRVDGYL